MDMTEHWRLRLLELLEEKATKPTPFAERCDITPSYFLRLLYPPGKPGRKNLGPENMRKISKACDLPPGWFDMPLGTSARNGQIEQMRGYGPSDQTTLREPIGEQVLPITGAVVWPFRAVTYRRIQRIRDHFSVRGRQNAISDIDKHLDILVARWEAEMEKQIRSAA